MIKFLMCMLLAFSAMATETIELTKKNSIVFNQAFTGKYVSEKQQEFIDLVSTLDENTPIYLVLFTPGGSISAGLKFIDTIKAYKNPVHTITIFSASMGYQVVQNLGTRYILPSGTLMSHRARGGIRGEFDGELDTQYKHVKALLKQMETVASKRSNLSLAQYKDLIKDEYWATGAKAVADGHADKLAYIKCGADLMGTRIETVFTLFGRFNVEFSNCPIITAPISVKGKASVEDIQRINDLFTNIENYVTMEL
jgi:ATP-dependent protease ClpP protease subunit